MVGSKESGGKVYAPSKGKRGHKRSRKLAQRLAKNPNAARVGSRKKRFSKKDEDKKNLNQDEGSQGQVLSKEERHKLRLAEEEKRKKLEEERQKIAAMNAKEFMEGGFEKLLSKIASSDEEDDDDDDEFSTEQVPMDQDEDEDEAEEEDLSEAEEEDEEDDDIGALGNEVKTHRKQLEELKKIDPEFYAHLQKSAPALLEFGDDDEDSEDDDASEEDEDASEEKERSEAMTEEEERNKKERVEKTPILTNKMLDDWQRLVMREKLTSLKTLKKYTRAMKAAVAFGGGSVGMNEEGNIGGEGLDSFRILNSDVYNRLLSFCLSELPECFRRYLQMPEPHMEGLSPENDDDDNDNGNDSDEDHTSSMSGVGSSKSRLPHRCKLYGKLRSTVRLYLELVIAYLRQVSDEHMLCFVLRKADRLLVPFFASERRMAPPFLRAIADIWASEHEGARVLAFLALRAIVLQIPYPFLHKVLRHTYLTYVRCATSGSPPARASQAFMRACLTELYGIDFTASYQHAFMYIRQLAVHFRNALAVRSQHKKSGGGKGAKEGEEDMRAGAIGKRKKKSKKQQDAAEPLAQLFTHQILNSLRAWVQILCAYPKQSLLAQLQYPIAQILLGIAATAPGDRYLPARFHCVSMCIHVSSACQVLIPVAPLILDALDRAVAYRGKHSAKQNQRTLKANVHEIFAPQCIHVSRKQVGTLPFLDATVQRSLHLLLLHAHTQVRSVAFPEFVFPLLQRIRYFLKQCRRAPWSKLARTLMEQLQKHSDWLSQNRSRVSFSPRDLHEVEAFLEPSSSDEPIGPLGRYVKRYLADYKRQHAEITDEWDPTQTIGDSIPELQIEASNEDLFSVKNKKKQNSSEKRKRTVDTQMAKKNTKLKKAPRHDSHLPDVVGEFVLSDSDSE